MEAPAARELVRPHVDSFNALFGPRGGIALAVKDLPTIRLWSYPGAPRAPTSCTLAIVVLSTSGPSLTVSFSLDQESGY